MTLSKTRAAFKWAARVFLVAVFIIVLWISVIAFPQPMFPNSKTYGSITMYSDEELGPDIDIVMNEVISRLKTASMYDENSSYRIFICNSQKKFNFYVRLCLKEPVIQGLNLSIFGNSFISAQTVKALGESHIHNPRYNIRNGSLAHVICHELAHNYHSDIFGLLGYRKQPMWKTEGIAEYGAHYGAILRDSTASLKNRISEYLDDSRWYPGDTYVKKIFLSELMVEYLLHEKNLTIDQICKEDVEYSDAYNAMLDWYNND